MSQLSIIFLNINKIFCCKK